MDEKRETFKIKRKRKPSQDNDFDGLVKMKMATERAKTHRPKESKSTSKQQPKGEDKMLENLKEMQASLKNKLELVQIESIAEESATRQMSATARLPRMNNEDLIKELKLEIITKIERENQDKEKSRRKKK